VTVPAWKHQLEAARLPPTPEQQAWDGHWCRWLGIAVRSGRSPNDAIKIAWTRTKSQYGLRPGTPEESQT
jgi:hypothetical protein